jgi:hypothetical protein
MQTTLADAQNSIYTSLWIGNTKKCGIRHPTVRILNIGLIRSRVTYIVDMNLSPFVIISGFTHTPSVLPSPSAQPVRLKADLSAAVTHKAAKELQLKAAVLEANEARNLLDRRTQSSNTSS